MNNDEMWHEINRKIMVLEDRQNRIEADRIIAAPKMQPQMYLVMGTTAEQWAEYTPEERQQVIEHILPVSVPRQTREQILNEFYAACMEAEERFGQAPRAFSRTQWYKMIDALDHCTDKLLHMRD